MRPARPHVAGALLLSVLAVACGTPGSAQPTATVDPLSVARACAPAGWTADLFPFGARDYGFGPGTDIGRIRLLVPASVAAGRGLSKTGGARFITDWWTVTDHEARSITFAGGRTGTQYRSRSGTEITTEFTTAAGTWQLYARSDEHYDEVLRCVEPRLVAAAR